jgi:hypothetical protein
VIVILTVGNDPTLELSINPFFNGFDAVKNRRCILVKLVNV